MQMGQIFNIGDVIGNYCNGYFGRDDYADKRCVMIKAKYAVFEYEDGRAVILNYEEGLEDVAKTANWSNDDSLEQE